jgi:hypothetical protein
MHARLVLAEHRRATNASLQVRRNPKHRNVRCCKPCQCSVAPNGVAGLARGRLASVRDWGRERDDRAGDSGVCSKRAEMGAAGV